jgi:signal recognition particle receptor subunit beta
LAGSTLLVLANKQDLSSTSPNDIAGLLELNQRIQYHNRHWAIYGCSAKTGDGLQEAMDWLVEDITSRIF